MHRRADRGATMEDEGFVEDDFIDETAREFVGRYGFASLAVLREHAAIAEAAGDYLLAQTWREIVEAAERSAVTGPSSLLRPPGRAIRLRALQRFRMQRHDLSVS